MSVLLRERRGRKVDKFRESLTENLENQGLFCLDKRHPLSYKLYSVSCGILKECMGFKRGYLLEPNKGL